MVTIVEKEIDGTIYQAQFRGMAYAYALDTFIETNKSEYRLTVKLFEDILVSPKVGIDDFELDALEKVRSFLIDVARGDFGEKLSKAKLQQQVDDEWACYRLVVNDLCPLDYDFVFNRATPQEIKKLNIALDKVYKSINSKRKSK